MLVRRWRKASLDITLTYDYDNRDAGGKLWEDQFNTYGTVWYHWDSLSGALQTPYRYTGQRYETSIDLYDCGARFYDQLAGRFTQPDTIPAERGECGPGGN